MNFYTLASKMNKDVTREAMRFAVLPGQTFAEQHEIQMHFAQEEFDRNCKLGLILMKRFRRLEREINNESADEPPVERTTGCYFITIRPKDDSIPFDAFQLIVDKFVRRKMITWYSFSYEQKGVDEESLGKGFHVHIIVKTTCTSKAELLRNAISAFKCCTEPNCIDVKLCKTPNSVITKYLLNYESEDGHKIVTKEMDALWRKNNALESLYTSSVPLDEEQCQIESET